MKGNVETIEQQGKMWKGLYSRGNVKRIVQQEKC